MYDCGGEVRRWGEWVGGIYMCVLTWDSVYSENIYTCVCVLMNGVADVRLR